MYHITVKNPKHVEKGVEKVLLNGVMVDGPVYSNDSEAEVTVYMG